MADGDLFFTNKDVLMWRGRAAAIHLLVSCIVAALLAGLILLLWYPPPYDAMADGRKLFWIVVSVDIVMGPLLTLVIFNRRKGRQQLIRDLGVVTFLQALALVYGVQTVYVARPVALVFEVDRFRLVYAADVRREELALAPVEYRQLPWKNRWLLSTRVSRPEEILDSIQLAMQGYDVGQRPTYWQPYEKSIQQVVKRARPVQLLIERDPRLADNIRLRLESLGVNFASAKFLPLVTRVSGWAVILHSNGRIAGFVPYEGFL